MPDIPVNDTPPGVASLVGGIIEDTQTLIRQEVALARQELQEEWVKTKAAAAMLYGAAIFSGSAVLLLGFFLANALETVWPYPWACFLIVGMAYAVLGGLQMAAAVRKMNEIHLVPSQTTDSVRRDVRAVASAASQPNPYVRR